MGSGEENAQAKQMAVATTAAMAPTSQEPPTTPSMYPDWQSMAAYYGGAAAAGTPSAFFSPPSPAPYMWGGQHMMAPYGTPVPYHPMYPPGMYPHPGIALGAAVTGAVEMEGRHDGKDHNSTKKSKNNSANANQTHSKTTDVKETSAPANEDACQSDASGSEDSSNAGDQAPNSQDHSTNGKRSYDNMSTDGVPAPATNLHIGMDIWNATHAMPIHTKERPNAANIAPPIAPNMVGRDGGPGNQWVPDERELKRQKRKESNRESARRSRQRKQQECEELAKKVEELSSENNNLRSEIDQLKQKLKMLESENASMREEFGQAGGPGLPSAIEGNSINSSVTQTAQQ